MLKSRLNAARSAARAGLRRLRHRIGQRVAVHISRCDHPHHSTRRRVLRHRPRRRIISRREHRHRMRHRALSGPRRRPARREGVAIARGGPQEHADISRARRIGLTRGTADHREHAIAGARPRPRPRHHQHAAVRIGQRRRQLHTRPRRADDRHHPGLVVGDDCAADVDANSVVSAAVFPAGWAVPLEFVSNRPAWKGGEILPVAAGGGHAHFPCIRGLEHHHISGPGRERKRRTVRNGEDQGSPHKRVGRDETRTGLGRSAAPVNPTDLKGYRVILRIRRNDRDAGKDIAIRAVPGGEGLSVVSVIGGKLIPALTPIADQHHRRVVIVHRHRHTQRQPLIVGVHRRGRVRQRHHIIHRVQIMSSSHRHRLPGRPIRGRERQPVVRQPPTTTRPFPPAPTPTPSHPPTVPSPTPPCRCQSHPRPPPAPPQLCR